MKKRMLAITFAFLLPLAACGNTDVASDANTLTNQPAAASAEANGTDTINTTSDIAVYPTQYPELMDISQITSPPETIFTTWASENGYGDTTFVFDGTVKDYVEQDEEGYEHFVLSTDQGDIWISSIFPTFSDYFTLPKQVGEQVRVYAQYTGYSEKQKIACAFLGDNDYFAKLYDTTSAQEQENITRDAMQKSAQTSFAEYQQAREALSSLEYDQIEIGMTLQEVEAITGFSGSEVSASANATGEVSCYEWEGKNIVISVYFTNDKVTQKSKVNL